MSKSAPGTGWKLVEQVVDKVAGGLPHQLAPNVCVILGKFCGSTKLSTTYANVWTHAFRPMVDNNDDDVEECQYGWQENELADFGQWLLRQLLLLAGEGRGGKGPGSTCGRALLFTYNSPPPAAHPHMHTHTFRILRELGSRA